MSKKRFNTVSFLLSFFDSKFSYTNIMNNKINTKKKILKLYYELIKKGGKIF